MILVIDNYDSFTYNLVQLLGAHKADFRVVRNDKTTVESIAQMSPKGIVISPGPGRPEQAGICGDVIRTLGQTIPILGVCLGHQAIGHAFGASIAYAPQLMHGKTSLINHTGEGIFTNIPNPFQATRYHSLVVDRRNLPGDLLITAATDDGVIMALRHVRYPIVGVQFHPESILTTQGSAILKNWLNLMSSLIQRNQ